MRHSTMIPGEFGFRTNPLLRVTLVRVSLGVLLTLFTSSCGSVTRLDFRPREERLELRGPVLVVDRVDDQRATEPTGSLWTSLIPGFPEQTTLDPQPERHELLDLDPAPELRVALAQLAGESRTFSQVVTEPDDIQRRGKVLHLTTRLKRLSFEHTQNTHRVGFLAPVLWTLAWPTGRIYTTLEMEIELTTSLGQRVWSTEISQRRERLRGFYFNFDWRRSLVEDFEEMLRNEWRRVLPELRPLAQESN